MKKRIKKKGACKSKKPYGIVCGASIAIAISGIALMSSGLKTQEKLVNDSGYKEANEQYISQKIDEYAEGHKAGEISDEEFAPLMNNPPHITSGEYMNSDAVSEETRNAYEKAKTLTLSGVGLYAVGASPIIFMLGTIFAKNLTQKQEKREEQEEDEIDLV